MIFFLDWEIQRIHLPYMVRGTLRIFKSMNLLTFIAKFHFGGFSRGGGRLLPETPLYEGLREYLVSSLICIEEYDAAYACSVVVEEKLL